MAQEADRLWDLQMLQFLYKLITKLSILEHLAPHGSGGRLLDGWLAGCLAGWMAG